MGKLYDSLPDDPEFWDAVEKERDRLHIEKHGVPAPRAAGIVFTEEDVAEDMTGFFKELQAHCPEGLLVRQVPTRIASGSLFAAMKRE